MTTKRAALVLCALIFISACDRGPTSPTPPPPGEQPLPPNTPANEIYSIPASYISVAHGQPRVEVPEGAIQIRITKVKPGRGSVLSFDSPSYYSSAGIEFDLITRADLPDFFYNLRFHLVDESGNELPTAWLSGGTSGPPPAGIRPNMNFKNESWMMVVGTNSNIPAHVPTLGIKYLWGNSRMDLAGFVLNADGSQVQTILRPSLNWHTPQ